MVQDNIIEENGQYIVRDTTSGGYVDRMTYNLSQHWKTVWDKDLNFVSLTLSNMDLTKVILAKDKSNYDYHRAVRAKSRHLKLLKKHLGIEVKEPSKKKKEVKKVILHEKGLHSRLQLLKIENVIIHEKTLEGGWNYKKFNVDYTETTPEKEELMEEYNQRLKDFMEYQNYMLKRIFEEY